MSRLTTNVVTAVYSSPSGFHLYAKFKPFLLDGGSLQMKIAKCVYFVGVEESIFRDGKRHWYIDGQVHYCPGDYIEK